MKDKDTKILEEAYDDRIAARKRAAELGYPEGSESYEYEEEPYEGIITVRTIKKDRHPAVGGVQGPGIGEDDDIKDVQFQSEEAAASYIAKILPQLKNFEKVYIFGK